MGQFKKFLKENGYAYGGTGMKPPNSPLRTKYPMIYVNLVDGSHQRP